MPNGALDEMLNEKRPTRAEQTRVRPRDAASMVIVRERRGHYEVLMGRRPTRDRFMPDVYVFPGGGVDPGDRISEIESALPVHEARKVCPAGELRRSQTLAVAAVRETFEETGLLIGREREGKLLPDLKGLAYLGRAITPASSRTRYHARFFLTPFEDVSGSLRSNGELLDLEWLSFAAAARLPIINVTQSILEEALLCSEGRPSAGSLFIHYRAGTMQRRYE